MKLVTAKGDLITVSKRENADLFWGIRGAGFNFGIVTEATYKVYDTTFNGQVMEGDLLFSANASRSIWQIIESYDNTLPAELTLSAVVTFDATLGQVSRLFEYSRIGRPLTLLRSSHELS